MEHLNAAARQKVIDILRAGRDMTLATIRPDGYPQATTVSYASDGLTIYAAIGLGSQKAENIQHNNKVSGTINLAYANWHDIRGVSFSGTAAFVRGEESITEAAGKILQKFPEAKEFTLPGSPDAMQGLLFVRIEMTVVSLLDYSIGFGHTELYQLA